MFADKVMYYISIIATGIKMKHTVTLNKVVGLIIIGPQMLRLRLRM